MKHTHLVPCRDCAKFDLMRRLARTEKERQQIDKLKAAHLGKEYQPDQPELSGVRQ